MISVTKRVPHHESKDPRKSVTFKKNKERKRRKKERKGIKESTEKKRRKTV